MLFIVPSALLGLMSLFLLSLLFDKLHGDRECGRLCLLCWMMRLAGIAAFPLGICLFIEILRAVQK